MSKVLITIFFLLFATPIYSESNLKINELLADPPSGYGEWVELYFPATVFDISSYYLKDTANNKKQLNITQTCGNFVVYNLVTSSGNPSDGWLNNSGQESIFLYDGNDNLIDSFENWTNPGEGKTLGRIPDGSSNWQETQEPTKCGENSQAIPSPSPSPSPTPSPSPSPKSPSPTTTNPSKSTSTAKSPSPQAQPQGQAAKTQQATVLGEKESTATATPSASPSPSPTPTPQSKTGKTKIAAVLSGSGLVLIGLAGGIYLWYTHKSKKDNEE